MSAQRADVLNGNFKGVHSIGILCGVVAGVWLGGAEAPAKLVVTGLSPYAVSLCMVLGVFCARWTVPALLIGCRHVVVDLASRRHLIVWAVLAGALWAIANTLTVFAIRDVGLSIAFPLWNANSLIGMFWGWLLFNEMRGAGFANGAKVVGGALAITLGAVGLAIETVGNHAGTAAHPVQGVCAALAASLLWGTMYVPYRKAYLSGMNPLSFVTVFTVGEVLTMGLLAVNLSGGVHALGVELSGARHLLFWLFLGGFCWVIGDMFQQYATKYVGIGRGIPLSNTNQLWGLAWGALVFHELAGLGDRRAMFVLVSSVVMVIGAALISTSSANALEQSSRDRAIQRECDRYWLSTVECTEAQSGISHTEPLAGRSVWDTIIVTCAVGVFVLLGLNAQPPALHLSITAIGWLAGVMLLSAGAGGYMLWKRTQFS